MRRYEKRCLGFVTDASEQMVVPFHLERSSMRSCLEFCFVFFDCEVLSTLMRRGVAKPLRCEIGSFSI